MPQSEAMNLKTSGYDLYFAVNIEEVTVGGYGLSGFWLYRDL